MLLAKITWQQQFRKLFSLYGHQRTCPLTDLWYKGVRLCFLLPGCGWQEMEEERGIGMGPVEVDGAEPVLRATGGSEEPLSISDTGDMTWICCWEEATALKRTLITAFNMFFFFFFIYYSYPDITSCLVIKKNLPSSIRLEHTAMCIDHANLRYFRGHPMH